jgi:glycosyltransferase involved in cell wall biosynthesis
MPDIMMYAPTRDERWSPSRSLLTDVVTRGVAVGADAAVQTAVKRVLFVAYAFPPVGGAGVQRTTKFVKYLRNAGWTASVLTVNEASVPVLDYSLTPDVPKDTIVRRARTFEPSYSLKKAAADGPRSGLRQMAMRQFRQLGRTVLQPDAQILWAPDATREGMRLLSSVPHDAIIASGPPFSGFLVGATLARRMRLPLILDYRDEWDLSNLHYENRRPGRITTALQRAMEKWALRSATGVLATTKASADALRDRARSAGAPADVTWIYNGFDPVDFSFDHEMARQPETAARRFRLVYTGTLWNLMSIEPLLEALTQLNARRPDLVAQLEVIFAGRCLPEQQVFVERLKQLACGVTMHDYLEHDKAVRLMCSADALCLLLADKQGADRWVPGKTFEYMASGRPILGVVPPGEVRELLARHPHTTLLGPREVASVERWLERELTAHIRGERRAASAVGVCPHNREVQAQQLAAVLDQACGKVERRWWPDAEEQAGSDVRVSV